MKIVAALTGSALMGISIAAGISGIAPHVISFVNEYQIGLTDVGIVAFPLGIVCCWFANKR